jgi:hypothetical protein
MSRLPFMLSRNTERAAIDRVILDPLKRQLLYDMVDAVLRVRESCAVSAPDLAPILAGFQATDEAVWSRAAGWLAKLHQFVPELSTFLEQLATHRSAVVRGHLCACLDYFPAEVALVHLRRFLSDRSARIRGTVCSVAIKAGYRDLIPDFEALLKEEPDNQQGEDLREAIALLRGETFQRNG